MTRRTVAAVAALILVLAGCVSGSPALAIPVAPRTAPTGPVVTVAGDSIADGGWQGGGIPLPERIADRTIGPDRTRLHTAAEGGECLVATGCVGLPLVARWPAILSATPAPTTVIVLAGTNDLTHVLDDTVLQAAYRSLVDQGAAVGVRVLLCTIPPRDSSMWPSYWWWGPQRERINTWLRATFPDDLVDVDAVLRRADGWADPQWMRPGDPIHPSWIGAVRIADAVPLGRVQ